MAKNQFLNRMGKLLKLPEMQLHEKIDLFDFLNFLAHCASPPLSKPSQVTNFFSTFVKAEKKNILKKSFFSLRQKGILTENSAKLKYT